MAYRYGNKKRKNKQKNFKKDVKSLAYKLGVVQKGLKNPNSQITESYNAGLNSAKKENKPFS